MEGPRLCQVVLDRDMKPLMGLANCTPLSKPPWSRAAAFLEGRVLGLQCQTLQVAEACLSLLIPDARGYSQSRQSPVSALGPHALKNTSNQSELGYNGFFKTALERYRVIASSCDGLPGAETSCRHACMHACLLVSLLKDLFDFKLYACMPVSVWV